MNARDAILANVRAALGGRVPTAETQAAIDVHMAARPVGPRTALSWQPQARFRQRALSLSSTLDEVAASAEAPAAVARYLAANNLPTRGVCWPQLGQIDWRSAGLDIAPRPAAGEDLVGITGAFCAIADTGTLMLLAGPDTPAATSLLPETHIAIVPVSRIVPFMEDGWALLRAERGQPPRAVNFVSGPSRTADIEQTVTLGAHGPYRVHVILVAD
ncbi:MAG: lactate utilization protein C [Defluviicoccus sp.]|nr:lactate utilization protein C [Defluviicoccus sp.]